MHTGRTLHASHFAFLRGVVQGLPASSMWDRYLELEGESTDERVVKRLTRQLREDLALLALRAGKPGSSRLLRLDLRELGAKRQQALEDHKAQAEQARRYLAPAPAAPVVPTLEEFVAEHGLEDFSEVEQLEAFESVHGRDRRETALARLIKKQLALINELAVQASRRPKLEDVVEAWLPARLHVRLKAAGIMTLYGLAKAMLEAPRTWINRVPGLGEKKAAQLRQWLEDERLLSRDGAPGQAGSALVVLSEPAKTLSEQAAVVLRTPGDFARAHNLLGAQDDVQAVQIWLSGLSGHTQRAYRKEAERVALWAALVLRRPLSSLTYEDLLRYRDFLLDPQPREQWVGPPGMPRTDPRWRPFSGPLSPASATHALRIVGALYTFWTAKGYVQGNPAAGIRVEQAKRSLRQQFGARTLKEGDLEVLLQSLGHTPKDRRTHLALELLYATGIRSSELLGAKFSDLEWFEAGEVRGWMLYVLGKGSKVRNVPVPAELIEQAQDLARLRGVQVDLAQGILPASPLLGHVGPKVAQVARDVHGAQVPPQVPPDAPLAYETFFNAIKDHVRKVAQDLRLLGDAEQAARAARIEQASAHWLRHTFATEALAEGADRGVVQENLGHASAAMLSVYSSVSEQRRLQAMSKFWKSRVPGAST